MAPPKRPWFRFYVEAFSDTDVRALPVAHRWTWAAVMGMARASPVAGVLIDKAGEPIGEKVIADFAAVRPMDVRAALERFQALGWITHNDTGAVVLTKWDRRQFESDDVTARTARHRAERNGDRTPDTPPHGTFHGGGDGTVPPSVRTTEVTEEQRTDPPPSASEEPPEAPEHGGDGIDKVLNEAARILAEAEAERRGSEIANRAGYVRARLTPIRAEHETAWRRLIEVTAAITAEDLAAGITTVTATTADIAVAAMRSRIDLTERRRRGDTCPDCDDRGVVQVGDGVFTDCPCKTRRAS